MAELGTGRPIVFCYGFPSCGTRGATSCRRLAAAGYRALAPDMRGYGESSAPAQIEAYDLPSLCGDLIALLDEAGEEQAVFVGHDWGATVVWHLALTHPDARRRRGRPQRALRPAPAPLIELLRAALGGDFASSGSSSPASPTRRWRATCAARSPPHAHGRARGRTKPDDPRRPRWLSEDDLRVYAEAFERTGFTGA